MFSTNWHCATTHPFLQLGCFSDVLILVAELKPETQPQVPLWKNDGKQVLEWSAIEQQDFCAQHRFKKTHHREQQLSISISRRRRRRRRRRHRKNSTGVETVFDYFLSEVFIRIFPNQPSNWNSIGLDGFWKKLNSSDSQIAFSNYFFASRLVRRKLMRTRLIRHLLCCCLL